MATQDKVKLISLAVIFIMVTVAVIAGWTTATDVAALKWTYSWRSNALTQMMLGITFLGSTPLISFAALCVFFALWIKKYKNESFLLAATLISSVALDNIMKYLIHRDRPDIAPLVNDGFFGFPSGHAMNSFVFYGLLIYLAARWIKNKNLSYAISAAALVLVFFIGFSRVYLGAHYPTDVIGGFAIGSFVLCGAIAIAKRTFKKASSGE